MTVTSTLDSSMAWSSSGAETVSALGLLRQKSEGLVLTDDIVAACLEGGWVQVGVEVNYHAWVHYREGGWAKARQCKGALL